jgi:hypothetical protein
MLKLPIATRSTRVLAFSYADKSITKAVMERVKKEFEAAGFVFIAIPTKPDSVPHMEMWHGEVEL